MWALHEVWEGIIYQTGSVEDLIRYEKDFTRRIEERQQQITDMAEGSKTAEDCPESEDV